MSKHDCVRRGRRPAAPAVAEQPEAAAAAGRAGRAASSERTQKVGMAPLPLASTPPTLRGRDGGADQ
jgi:hypothetical protein